MTGRWVMPVDPECPDVATFTSNLWGDPMTSYSGCGDEIQQHWETRHRVTCRRCQDYGCANIDVRLLTEHKKMRAPGSQTNNQEQHTRQSNAVVMLRHEING
jgi:hypothetical protein